LCDDENNLMGTPVPDKLKKKLSMCLGLIDVTAEQTPRKKSRFVRGQIIEVYLPNLSEICKAAVLSAPFLLIRSPTLIVIPFSYKTDGGKRWELRHVTVVSTRRVIRKTDYILSACDQNYIDDKLRNYFNLTPRK